MRSAATMASSKARATAALPSPSSLKPPTTFRSSPAARATARSSNATRRATSLALSTAAKRGTCVGESAVGERRRPACRPAAVPAAVLAKTYIDSNGARTPRSHGRDAHAPAGEDARAPSATPTA
jgi:hypothetical protein